MPKTTERLEYSWEVSKVLRRLVRSSEINVVESCEAYSIGFWFYLMHRSPALIIKLHTPEAIIFKWNKKNINLDVNLLSKMEEWWILKAKALIAITQAMKELMKEFYKLRLDGIPIIRNPFTIPELEQREKGEKFFLFVGRLEFRKGPHILMEAIPYIIREFPEVKFYFVGQDCGMKPYLLDKIKEKKCEPNVVFYDYLPREEILKLYPQALGCIISSLWENFSYVLLEAMALNCPVVASNVGGFPEIIKDREDGLLFEAGSFIDLVDKIRILLEKPELYSRISKNALSTVKKFTNPLQIARETEKIYRDVCKSVS